MNFLPQREDWSQLLFCAGLLLETKGKQRGSFKGGGKRNLEQKDLCDSLWLARASAASSGRPAACMLGAGGTPAPRPQKEVAAVGPSAAAFHFAFARDSLQPPFFTALCKLWGSAGWKCSLFRSGAVAFGFYSPKITSRWSRAHITAQKPHGSHAGKGSRELLK